MHSGRSWNVCCETTWGIVNYSALWWSLKRRITRCQFINICGCCHLFVYLFILGGVSLPQYRHQKLKRENELYTTFSLLVEIWNKGVNPLKCHYFEEKKPPHLFVWIYRFSCFLKQDAATWWRRWWAWPREEGIDRKLPELRATHPGSITAMPGLQVRRCQMHQK